MEIIIGILVYLIIVITILLFGWLLKKSDDSMADRINTHSKSS